MSSGFVKAAMATLLSMTMAGAALADTGNRFNDRDGGMVGGTGNFSEGNVTVYHHFRDVDRQELNDRIAELEALIQALGGQIQAKEQRALDLRQNYDNTRAKMNRMRRQYRL